MSQSPACPCEFRGTIVTDWSDATQLRQLVNDYRAILLTVGGTILDRYERDPAYRFVDTKLSLLTGRDFPDADPIRGREAIYGWIQARALESLASLGAWIERQDWLAPAVREGFRGPIEKLLREVLAHLEELRRANGGRLFFLMDRGGRPLRVTEGGGVAVQEPPADPPTSMTDLYYCIGKATASAWLGLGDHLEQACREFLEICQDLRTGRFYLGQVPLDPRNSMVQPIQGKHFHLGRTIAIKGAARFLECTGREQFLDIGLEFIDHVLARYVNLGRGEGGLPLRPGGSLPVRVPPPAVSSSSPEGGKAKEEEKERGQEARETQGRDALATARYDMWEFIGEDGRPYIENGTLLGDPGTVMEFVGFCLKLARQARAGGLVRKENLSRVALIEAAAPEILKRCFAIGFSPGGMGLVRAIDLCSGRFLNDHLSWWGQMEGLRSAVLAAEIGLPSQRREIERLAAKVSNAYVGHFVRRNLGLMAYQTIDQAGKPTDAIPATPDADVLYHTGLCLFDCLDVVEKRLI